MLSVHLGGSYQRRIPVFQRGEQMIRDIPIPQEQKQRYSDGHDDLSGPLLSREPEQNQPDQQNFHAKGNREEQTGNNLLQGQHASFDSVGEVWTLLDPTV
jgi:hypothetical protein